MDGEERVAVGEEEMAGGGSIPVEMRSWQVAD
jgi:hypothetical protein